MKDSRISLMESALIHKAVNTISMPAIGGLIIMALYNIVDTMFVAWIGTEATGATQIVMPIIMLASSIGLAIGVGGGAVLSRLLGQKDFEKASCLSSTLLLIGVITGILFIIMNLLFLHEVLVFFGATSDIYTLAEEYGFYIILGGMFLIANMVMNNLMRAEGSAVLSMYGMAAGAVLNIILDPLFIFTFGWGIQGAAIATTLSQGTTTAILLTFYLRQITVCTLKFGYITMKWELLKGTLTVGIPTFFKQLLFSLSMAVMNQYAIIYGGADLLATTGVLLRVTMLPTYIIFGLGQGAQPVIGFNQGAGNITRARQSFFYALKAGAVMMVLNAVILLFGANTIMDIFKASKEVTAYGILGLKAYAFGLILYSFSNTITVLFQALGRGFESLVLSTARQGFILIPLIIFMGKIYGSSGVLLAQTAADVLTFIISIAFVIPLLRKLKGEEKLNYGIINAVQN